MNLVEGVPTGGVGNEGLGLPSVGSTVKPSRFTWTRPFDCFVRRRRKK